MVWYEIKFPERLVSQNTQLRKEKKKKRKKKRTGRRNIIEGSAAQSKTDA
jgi:hypothetical protein